MNYFIKWQKWANQFPEVNATSAEEIYVIIYRKTPVIVPPGYKPIKSETDFSSWL